jgi:hypothetical protein
MAQWEKLEEESGLFVVEFSPDRRPFFVLCFAYERSPLLSVSA